METLLRKMRVKYDINRLNKKELMEYLCDSNKYNEFIKDFQLVLYKEIGYEFIYLDKLKPIRKSILKNKKSRDLTTSEKKILKRISLENLTYKQKIDFKTQHIYSYLYRLGIPGSLRGESFYKKVVNSNYENVFRFYDILNNTNAYYRENALLVLTGDITTLVTINTIANESKEIDSELFDLLVDISSRKVEKDSFESSRDYHRYKKYQSKTLKQLRDSVDKVRDINNTNDKILVK